MTLIPSALVDGDPKPVSDLVHSKGDAVPVPVSPPPANKMAQWFAWLKAHKWVSGLAVIVVLALAYMAFRYFDGTSVPVEVVRRADLVETVVASGHVESPNRVDIASQITGTVTSVAVREGEIVREGQPLIFLSADELTGAAAQAQGAVGAAQARIRQVNELSLPQALETVNSAESSLLGTQQVYDRASALLDRGFVTRAYFDDVKKNRDIARAQVEAAKAQVLSASDGGSDFASAQATLAQAQAGVAAAISRLDYTTISAPRAGILIARKVEQGAVVVPGASLMVLAPQGSTQIVLQIDERNLGKIAVGQAALVSADAYPTQRFAAIVTFINPAVDIARASATVKLSVTNPPAYLREDMTVSVDIEIARRAAILTLPNDAVHDALSSKPWVMTIENGRTVRRNVKLGLRGNTQIEIISGIQAGAVTIPVATQIKIGARVKPTSKPNAKSAVK
jgi:HlyD family secretion protein